MYRRYSQVGDGSMPLSQINRNRIKNILILVLVAALVAMAVWPHWAVTTGRERLFGQVDASRARLQRNLNDGALFDAGHAAKHRQTSQRDVRDSLLHVNGIDRLMVLIVNDINNCTTNTA